MKHPLRFVAGCLLAGASIAWSMWSAQRAMRVQHRLVDDGSRFDFESIGKPVAPVASAECLAELPECFAAVDHRKLPNETRMQIALDCVRAVLRMAIADDLVSMRSACADSNSVDVMLGVGLSSMRAALSGMENGRVRLGLEAVRVEDINFLRQFVVGKYVGHLDDCVAVGCDAFASVVVFADAGPRVLMMWSYDTNYDGVHSDLKNVWMCLDSACEEIDVEMGSVEPTELLLLPFKEQSWDMLVSKVEYLRFLRGYSQRNADLMEIDNPYGVESDPVSWDGDGGADRASSVDSRVIKTSFVVCDELMRTSFKSPDSTKESEWIPILVERSRRLGQLGDRKPIPFHVLCADGTVLRIYPSYVLAWRDIGVEEDRALAALIRCAYW